MTLNCWVVGFLAGSTGSIGEWDELEGEIETELHLYTVQRWSL